MQQWHGYLFSHQYVQEVKFHRSILATLKSLLLSAERPDHKETFGIVKFQMRR